ncbi:SMI1/KNR4 family protein [Actinospica durhamensis]|uniref:SMI1/KNR4 family protein n=1 Tax=Actinospica durhamensis TaxID=1508375 RepID=A0A941ITE3_9ACTN|nr:SMI1/KNR4 family protein [Actinospica durhamensis]MBR7839654.1 SMI1/KNR4 family protein [Actinospica durhamensis]
MGLVWSIERIAAENLRLRRDADFASLYMPFDSLLFFGDAGNDDLFGLVPHTGRLDVFVWNHGDDSRMWVARGLGDYLEGWLSGRITV